MFSPIHPVAGLQPFGVWFEPDSTQRHPLGMVIDAVDPYWGIGRFMYVTSTTTLGKGNLCMWTEGYVAAALPSTANQGFPFGVLAAPMVSGEFGWLQLVGFSPLSASASVAADVAAGIGTAGNVGANSAGKQLLGYRNRLASTATKVLTNVQTTNGSAVLKTSGYDGWFLGMALSGTGIPASTVVARLDSDGRTVYMGSAVYTVDKLATATGAVSVTGTYTGFVGGVYSNPFCQGAIT
jgi:hypothetical protein